MPMTGTIDQELVARLASDAVAGTEPPTVEPIVDESSGRQEGLLLESPWERVIVSYLEASALELSDVSHLRRVMARVQARRALLYVPHDTQVANPVMLLATLSKIQIVRIAHA